ncbi:DUF63 family protein [Halomarina litorea]|uniref:DUF63 family protein n=1 Tax=Halomarina litorea TaxID=2961595 RepID=UPI0020C46E29|nr:DUF63 family protein [Halomarina sp. BCD28]
MATLQHRVDPLQAWLGTLAGLVALLSGGMLVSRGLLYDGFLWPHLLGPLYAEAYAAECATLQGGVVSVHHEGCATATGLVALPGATLLGTAVTTLVLAFLLLGFLSLSLRRDLGSGRRFFYALVPFVLLAGVVLTLRDVSATYPRGLADTVGYPTNLLLAGPMLTLTLALLALLALVGSVLLVDWGVSDRYERPLLFAGLAALGLALGRFVVAATSTPDLGAYPAVPLVVLGGASLLAVVLWTALARLFPHVLAGTSAAGLVVLWGFAVNGVASVVGIDWAVALGLPTAYEATNPLYQVLVDLSRAALPASVVQWAGAALPVLLVQVAVALAVVWMFDDRVVSAVPRLSNALLLAVLGFVLVPGVRTLLWMSVGL